MNLDRVFLVVAWVGPQNPQSDAIVDCGAEGTSAFLADLSKWLNDFHVHL